MKGSYKNWMPDNTVRMTKVAAFFSLVFSMIFLVLSGVNKILNGEFIPVLLVLSVIFLIVGFAVIVLHKRFVYLREKFDFEDADSVAWRIINFVADKVKMQDENLKILDVGCGSGALSVKVALNNPNSKVEGIDIWPLSYKDFSKRLCYKNAESDGAKNARFTEGDAKSLKYKDESFDVVISNYVYHNIMVYPDSKKKRQEIILETLRVLKKGGTFAIHDIFSKGKYGNINDLVEQLKEMGYEEVELISTVNGEPMTKREAKKLLLSKSALLYGKK